MMLRLQAENPARAMPPACRTLAAWCDRLEAGITAAGIHLVPLHGENTLSNIMLGVGNDVRLVDFDHAANGDAFHDLGAFCLEYCSFDDEIAAAVELYVGRADGQALARSKLYMIIDDYMWGCWALIAHWSSPRATAIEFYKYARNRFVRAIYRLESWDVDALLRQA
jgi:thiamine kinase-like enzyme